VTLAPHARAEGVDWFSRYVLAWQLSNTLDGHFCQAALHQALRLGTPDIFNTDQGAQFTSSEFTDILLTKGIQVSIDGRGRALDNIFIERLWRSTIPPPVRQGKRLPLGAGKMTRQGGVMR